MLLVDQFDFARAVLTDAHATKEAIAGEKALLARARARGVRRQKQLDRVVRIEPAARSRR